MTNGEQLAAKVEDFADDLGESVEESVETGMDVTSAYTRKNLRENDSVVNRGLITSIDTDDGTVEGFRHSASTTIDAPYAPYVEYGTGSMQSGGDRQFKAPDPRPPLGPIKQWLIRKGNTEPQKYKGLREINPITAERDQQAELTNFAQAIADQIGTYGNRPHPYARPAARDGFNFTTSETIRKMRRALNRF